MKTIKLSITLLTLLVVLACCLLFSSHPKRQNYTIQGEVKYPGGNPVSIPVYITQDKRVPAFDDLEGMHCVRTVHRGRFTTQFHAEVNMPIYLYVAKPGHTLVRHTLEPDFRTGSEQVIAQPILFTDLHKKLDITDYYSNTGMPELPVFTEHCNSDPKSFIPVDKIQFVEGLSYESCPSAPVSLSGKIKAKGQPFSTTFFRRAGTAAAYRATKTKRN